MIKILFYLLSAHAITDYILQPMEMGKYKNPRSKVPKKLGYWYWWMIAHGLINGLGVSLATGNYQLGIAEVFVHSVTDYLKSIKVIGTDLDQGVHLASKVVWALLA